MKKKDAVGFSFYYGMVIVIYFMLLLSIISRIIYGVSQDSFYVALVVMGLFTWMLVDDTYKFRELLREIGVLEDGI